MVKIIRASYQVVFVGVCILTSLTSALGGDGDPRAPLDRRLQSLAGDSARNCGAVTLEESAKKANQCVRRTFSAKKAFYVRYDLASSDSVSGAGLAGNGIDVYLVVFDTARFTPGMTRGSEQLLDEAHSIVTPCPQADSISHSILIRQRANLSLAESEEPRTYVSPLADVSRRFHGLAAGR
jgi:hypothetical protein